MRFADAVQSEVVTPWWRKVRGWLRSLGESMPSEKGLTKAIRAGAMPDKAALKSTLKAYHREAANLGGQAALDRLAKTAPKAKAREALHVTEAGPQTREQALAPFTFNLRDPALLKELGKRGDKITGEVTATMLEDLRDVLARKFYDEGANPSEIAKDLDSIFPQTYANRSQNIARTETLFAQSAVQSETYQRNGVESKQWLAIIDTKTRDDHRALHGQVKPMDEPFVVPGDGDNPGAEIMFPGDPEAGPEEVCQCRCDYLAVYGEGYELPEQPWLGE